MSGMSGLFSSLDICASGIAAQRTRMDVAVSNMVNEPATRGDLGGPYLRRRVIFETVLKESLGGDPLEFRGAGVRVAEISADPELPEPIFDPTHPDHDQNGMVWLSNVRRENEFVDMLDAERAYEANATAFRISKQLIQRTLELGRA